MYKLFKMTILFGIIISLLLGCSSKPSEVREEVWEISNQTFDVLTEDMSNGDLLREYEYDIFEKVYNKYIESDEVVTEKEYEILKSIQTLVYHNHHTVSANLQNDTNKMIYHAEQYANTVSEVKLLLNRD